MNLLRIASRIVEVGPRDGLQNEAAAVSTADKIAFVDRLSAAGLPVDRGVGVRQPEVGAADGRRRRGVRRHHAATGDPLHGAGAEPRRARRARSRRRRRRGRGLRRGLRDVQPPEHQPDASTSRSRPTTRSCARARGARTCRVRGVCLDRVRLPVRRRVAPRRGRARSRARCSTSALTRSPSATRSASPIRARCRTSSTRSPHACRSTAVALHFHDTRGTALANVLAALDARHRDVRRLGRRPGRLSVRAGRGRQPRHRGSGLHAGRARDRDRRQPRPDAGRVAVHRSTKSVTRWPRATLPRSEVS